MSHKAHDHMPSRTSHHLSLFLSFCFFFYNFPPPIPSVLNALCSVPRYLNECLKIHLTWPLLDRFKKACPTLLYFQGVKKKKKRKEITPTLAHINNACLAVPGVTNEYYDVVPSWVISHCKQIPDYIWKVISKKYELKKTFVNQMSWERDKKKL